MAAVPDRKQSDEQDIPPRKPRRSVIRSLSWKRASKRSKMEETEHDRGVDTSVENGDDVDGGRSFNTTACSSTHGMSDEDAEDEIFELDDSASSSKKRKKSGVWKAMKRFFSRKSGKASKSFNVGDSKSPHAPAQRSVSDPNLARRPGERPDLAPLEQVDETPMETDVSPKKALSHESLLSELRSKQRKSVDGEKEISPSVNWQASPGSNPEQLLPGLSVSHDKIRVAPRHRRAPTRKGVSSVRHGGRDLPDVLPRSKSVGARTQVNAIQEEPEVKKEQGALQPHAENQKLGNENEEEQDKQRVQEDMKRKPDDLELDQKLEQDNQEREKHEKENLERQKSEKEKLEKERVKKEKLEKEKLEKEKEEQEKLEEEKLKTQKIEMEKIEQERLEKQRHEQEKLEKERIEQEKQENQRIEQENQRIEQEKQRIEEERLEQVRLEKVKLEQEKLAKEKEEQEKQEQQRLEQERKLEQETLQRQKAEQEKLEAREEERREEEKNELNKYSVQQTTDFSDLAESLRPVTNSKELYEEETTEVEMKEATSVLKTETLRDMTDTRGNDVILPQNIDIPAEKDVETAESGQNTPAVLDIKNSDNVDDQHTVVSPMLTVESTTKSPKEEIHRTNEVNVEGMFQHQTEESPEVTKEEYVPATKQAESVQLPAVEESDVNTVVIVAEEKRPPVSPPASVSSPSRRRLIIETPEKVYQKSTMTEVKAEEDRINQGGKGIERRRPQSVDSEIRPEVEKPRSQDDSNIGVAKLTQAFERSSRSYTISYGERRKKPGVLPKPKVPSKPKKSQTLERNYRFPVTANKPNETETPRKQSEDLVVVLDEKPPQKTETKENVSSSPAKKIPPKPKPLPKPKVKATKPNVAPKTTEEGKENIKKTPNSQSVTNGSVKMSGANLTDGKAHTGVVPKEAQPDLPSFWARRSMFSPEQKTNNSTSAQDAPEKTRDKPSPFIQLKTDTCAVCGSKVYQMEKFKVKDNIVHRSCIKCSVCKRLLSVGNFIMSQNKIYCKPHEPHIPISLATV